MQTQALPQYMRIAADLAGRIASGEFPEGQRLSGRSALSSGYHVSPETVRKALKLLADVGIVRTREGSGTVILSAEKADAWLETVGARGEQADLQNQLQALFRQYALEMNFEQYVLVGSTVRSYLSWLKDAGRLSVRFEDNRLLWERTA